MPTTFKSVERATETMRNIINSELHKYFDDEDTSGGENARLFGFAETYNLSDGDTLVMKVNGGGDQTATFNIADAVDLSVATAAEVALVINADITGVTASVVEGCDLKFLKIIEDTGGDDKSIEIISGDAMTKLGFFDQQRATGIVLDNIETQNIFIGTERKITDGGFPALVLEPGSLDWHDRRNQILLWVVVLIVYIVESDPRRLMKKAERIRSALWALFNDFPTLNGDAIDARLSDTIIQEVETGDKSHVREVSFLVTSKLDELAA